MLFTPGVACVCDEKYSLTLQVCSSYDVIFSGKVQESSPCEAGESLVTFEVSELYKGQVDPECNVRYICGAEDCSLDFQNDSEWLVFVNKNNAQECVFDLCSYSRVLLPDSFAVYDNEVRGTTFFQDKDFLVSNFDVNKRFSNELKARKYEKVEPKLVPVFLGVSLLFMLVGMFVFKKVSDKRK